MSQEMVRLTIKFLTYLTFISTVWVNYVPGDEMTDNQTFHISQFILLCGSSYVSGDGVTGCKISHKSHIYLTCVGPLMPQEMV